MSWNAAPEPGCASGEPSRIIELVIEPRARDLGDVTVRRVLPSASRRSVGPFVFFDHFGPIDFTPGRGMAVRPHPHIGLSTVTYLFEGEIVHRDSLGFERAIRPGAINWMTAGSGIVHSERTAPALRGTGSRLHGLQLWVGLPKRDEETEPAFFHHEAEALPAGRPFERRVGRRHGTSTSMYVPGRAALTASITAPSACCMRGQLVDRRQTIAIRREFG